MLFKVLVLVYRFIFARPFFCKFNKILFHLSLRGLGVLNYESDAVSGEVKFLKSRLSKLHNGYVLDVGANIGKYAKHVKRANPMVRIFCFEPHPQNFKILCENTRGIVSAAHNVAVGSSAGSMKLYDYRVNDGSSHASLYQDVIEKIHAQPSVSHDVAVITIDDFIVENDINRISLLKIDTEGHELAVLKGASKSISAGKIEAIHFEFNEMNVVSRIFMRDFFELLPNYKFYRLLPNGLLPFANYDPVFCEIFAFQNIVAIRN
jgi:FkbM family methyltransferase